jgi:hypothetical protein
MEELTLYNVSSIKEVYNHPARDEDSYASMGLQVKREDGTVFVVKLVGVKGEQIEVNA